MQRSFTIDVLKMIAAQLIVWHHIAAYGLIADTMKLQWPVVLDLVYDHARLAVQIFLVIAGYLAAQSLCHRPITKVLHVLGQRYARLVMPFVAALLWVMLTLYLTRPFIHADWLPDSPQALQFLAHVLLLNQLLDFPALSSGVWYVAIDFQLYALLAVLVYFFRPLKIWQHTVAKKMLSGVVACLCLLSLYWFNRLEAWNDWAIYFFGSYGLGVLAAWARRSDFDLAVFASTWFLGALSLLLAFRTRICVSLLCALVLYSFAHIQFHRSQLEPVAQQLVQRLVHRLANSAYAMFLTHFGVIVLFNALWGIGLFTHPMQALCFAVLTWLCSLAIGSLFHEHIELKLQSLRVQQLRFNFLRATS